MRLNKLLFVLWNKLSGFRRKLVNFPYNWSIGNLGENVHLGYGLRIEYPEYLSIGNHVYINDFVWFSILKFNRQLNFSDIELKPHITIGDGTYIGRFATISCMNNIKIGKKVMISDRVFIGDASHGYIDKDLAIIDQYMFSPGPIKIGDESWIGINVSILANVTIGKHCIIGANSVVTKDIPDYHIAAGIPAKIIRKI